jgi:sulfiredoxin
MMKRETLAIADIYVPVKRRATLDQKRVEEIATSMLDKGQQAPILVRADGARVVLVEGLHRLEAAKALREKTILCFLVDAQRAGRHILYVQNLGTDVALDQKATCVGVLRPGPPVPKTIGMVVVSGFGRQ